MKRSTKNEIIIIIGGCVMAFVAVPLLIALILALMRNGFNYAASLADPFVWLSGLIGVGGFLVFYFMKLKKIIFKDKKRMLNKHLWDYESYCKSKKFHISTDKKAWGWVVESRLANEKEIKKCSKKNDLSIIKKHSEGEKLIPIHKMLSNNHIVLLGTPGSGKTQNVILPTIIANAKSKIKPVMHITDPKMELCRMTKDILEENGYEVFIFNIKDPTMSNFFNFLSLPFSKFKKYLLNKENDIEVALNWRNKCFTELDTILTTLIIPDVNDSTEQYFASQGKELFLGYTKLYLEKIEKTFDETGKIYDDIFNLPSIFKTCNEMKRETLEKIVNQKQAIENNWISSYEFAKNTGNEQKISEVLAKKPNFYSLAHLSQAAFVEQKQYQFYMKAITKGLMFLNDESFKALSLKNNFDFDTYLEKPLAIFIVIPDEDKSKDALSSAFVDILYTATIQKIDTEMNGKSPRPVLRILEEFNNLAPMRTIRSAILAGRGRNVFSMITIQSKSAVYHTYGKDEAHALLSSTNGIIYVANFETQTNQDIIDAIGTYNEYTYSEGTNESETSRNRSVSESKGEAERKILKMEDLRLKKPNRIHLMLNTEKPLLNLRTTPSWKMYDTLESDLNKFPKINLSELNNWIIQYHYNSNDLLSDSGIGQANKEDAKAVVKQTAVDNKIDEQFEEAINNFFNNGDVVSINDENTKNDSKWDKLEQEARKKQPNHINKINKEKKKEKIIKEHVNKQDKKDDDFDLTGI